MKIFPIASLGCSAILISLFNSCGEQKNQNPIRQGSYPEVRAILDRSCMSCHASGESPRLVTYDEVREAARTGLLSSVLDSTSSRHMPPGSPLPPEESNAIKAWIQNGMPSN